MSTTSCDPSYLNADDLEALRASGKLSDKELVLKLIRTQRFDTILQYLSPELQNDEKIVEAAIFRLQNGEVVSEIQHASERLRKDAVFIRSIRERLRKAPVQLLASFDTMIPSCIIVNGPDSIRDLTMAIREGNATAYEKHKRDVKPYMATYVLNLIAHQKPSGWTDMFVDIKTRYPEASLQWRDMLAILLSKDTVFTQVMPLLRNDADKISKLIYELIKLRDTDRLVYLCSGSTDCAYVILEEAFRLAQWSNTAKQLTYDDDDDLVMSDGVDMVITEELDHFIVHLIEALTVANCEPPKDLKQLVKRAVSLNALSSVAALLKLGAPLEDGLTNQAVPHACMLRLLLNFGARPDLECMMKICQYNDIQCLKTLSDKDMLGYKSHLAAYCVQWCASECLTFLLSLDVGCVVDRDVLKNFSNVSSVKTPARLEQLQDIMNVEDFTAFPCRCLPCNHVFHGEFLQTYLNEKIPDYEVTYTKCPTCKAEIKHVDIMSISAAKHWDKHELLAMESEKQQQKDLKAFKEETNYESLKRKLDELDARKKEISEAAETNQKKLREDRYNISSY
jgi:hypothetical protein